MTPEKIINTYFIVLLLFIEIFQIYNRNVNHHVVQLMILNIVKLPINKKLFFVNVY